MMPRVLLKDIRVDVYSSGLRDASPTVRITHIPTGIVIDRTEKSQLGGKAKALEALEERLIDRAWYPTP